MQFFTCKGVCHHVSDVSMYDFLFETSSKYKVILIYFVLSVPQSITDKRFVSFTTLKNLLPYGRSTFSNAVGLLLHLLYLCNFLSARISKFFFRVFFSLQHSFHAIQRRGVRFFLWLSHIL